MSNVKSWLMQMEEDAMNMSKTSFTQYHGIDNADIWDKYNGKEDFTSKEDEQQALAEIAMEMEIAAKEGR